MCPVAQAIIIILTAFIFFFFLAKTQIGRKSYFLNLPIFVFAFFFLLLLIQLRMKAKIMRLKKFQFLDDLNFFARWETEKFSCCVIILLFAVVSVVTHLN